MSSVLTNTSAMTALQVLASTNKQLGETQGRISTGLKVSSADQNAAVFAMTGVMRADLAGYKTINEGLGLAESALSVARSASEAINEVLQEIKTKITSAQDGNQDRTKLQQDIDQLTGQISTIASAASFNGINYLKGQDSVSILSSLDRNTADGAKYDVAANKIAFNRQNLVMGDAPPTAAVVAVGSTAVAATSSVTELDFTAGAANSGALDFKIGGNPVAQIDLTGDASVTDVVATINAASIAGVTAADVGGKIRITDAQGRGITDVAHTAGASGATLNSTTVIAAGNEAKNAVASETTYTFAAYKGDPGFDAGTFSGVVLTKTDGSTFALRNQAGLQAAKSMAEVATALATALNGAETTDTDNAYAVAWDAATGKLTVTDADSRGIAISFEGDGFGKLNSLLTLKVTSNEDATAALGTIESLIQDTLDTAATLGSIQKRVGVQREFLTKLSDAVETGIGTLVDADMTKESARLQSLQVRQQLATQALSIANQQPQNILALFR